MIGNKEKIEITNLSTRKATRKAIRKLAYHFYYSDSEVLLSGGPSGPFAWAGPGGPGKNMVEFKSRADAILSMLSQGSRVYASDDQGEMLAHFKEQTLTDFEACQKDPGKALSPLLQDLVESMVAEKEKKRIEDKKDQMSKISALLGK